MNNKAEEVVEEFDPNREEATDNVQEFSDEQMGLSMLDWLREDEQYEAFQKWEDWAINREIERIEATDEGSSTRYYFSDDEFEDDNFLYEE